jgi:uncharacterized membrane protein
MSEGLTGVLIVFIIFSAAAFVIKVVSDNRIRRRLIEGGQVDEKVKYLYFKSERRMYDPLSSVKWGMVLIGIGLALLLGQLFPYDITEEMTIGLMFLFAGIAFLIYYGLQKRQAAAQTSEPEV